MQNGRESVDRRYCVAGEFTINPYPLAGIQAKTRLAQILYPPYGHSLRAIPKGDEDR